MPLLSCFTAAGGFLEFSSAPSECEKVYRALVASYRDPRTGQMTLDLSVGTHKEAVLFGWANAIAAARVVLRRAAAELRPETSYCFLEEQERKFGLTPGPEDTVAQRQLALAAKQKAARGPRREAVDEALRAILGDDLVAYRPVTTAEAEAYPAAPLVGPGIFRRPDAVAKSIRLLSSAARINYLLILDANSDADGPEAAAYASGNVDIDVQLYAGSFVGAAMTFSPSSGGYVGTIGFLAKQSGAPPGDIFAKIYAHVGEFGETGTPGALLATSEAYPASNLGVDYTYMPRFYFYGENRIFLEPGKRYVVTVEYANGDAGNKVLVGASTSKAAAGNGVLLTGATWTAAAAYDLDFSVKTGGMLMTVPYENWNRALVEERVVRGDVLLVDPGDWGLAERVWVTDSSVDADGVRYLTAEFHRPHTVGALATTGPTPLWANSKRHVLIVVKSDAALDPATVARVNERMRSMARGPTTWAIVRPTTPGAATVGPFAVGTTSGSPLGAVPVEQITI